MSRHLSRLGIAAVSTLLAAGCIRFDHSLIDEPVAPRRSLDQRVCCDSVLGLEVHTLPANEYVTLVVDEDDPVIEFRTGRSFAKAVELPALSGEYVLQIDSVVYVPRVDLFPEAMYPMVTLLDERLNVVAVHDREPLDLRRPVLGPKLLRIVLTVEDGSAARYALIHTSQERVEHGMSMHPPREEVYRDGFDSMIYARPTQSRHKIHFVETGMVTLLAHQKHPHSGHP